MDEHNHNGNNSKQIDPKDLKGVRNYFANAIVTLTAAQIKLLHTTPVILIPSSGLTSTIIVTGIAAKIQYGGTAYTGANALEFRYTDGSGIKVTADIPNTFINSTITSYYYAPAITTAFAPLNNKPIVVAIPTANPATGVSTITFTIKYRIINF